jgi:hypothetical protein
VSYKQLQTPILPNERMKLTIILSSMFFACSLHAQQPAVAALQAEIAALQQQGTALQQQVAALKPLEALAPFISVDPSPENGVQGANITFHGANVHIVNGSGQTGIVNGLGNLIIGYDEEQPWIPFQQTQRVGSHNLIVGRYNNWMGTAFGKIVGGEGNWAVSEGGFIVGYQDESMGMEAAITGGTNNLTDADHSVIIGGENNGTNQAYQILPQ